MYLARLLSDIYKKNGIILIDSQGQKYICGKPSFENPLTLKLLKKNLNWKLLLNPDLTFPEAYMRGEIEIQNGSLLDFLNMTFENLGRNEINTSFKITAVGGISSAAGFGAIEGFNHALKTA